MTKDAKYYSAVIRNIYLYLPYTLFKQYFFYRFKRPRYVLPNFLCIGTQKSGTTWLYEQLKHHPDICLAETKEIHYFDWFFHRPLRWYSSLFKCDNKPIKGEITPGYSIVNFGRIKFIKRVMPQVKLILLLRDPRKRVWSSARFHFGKHLNRDLHTVSSEEFIKHFRTSWVQKRGNYEQIWKNWSEVFPASQILVIFTEEIERQPELVISRVLNFLDVKTTMEGNSLAEKHNKSQYLDMPDEVKEFLDQYYHSMIERMPQWLGMENHYWKI